MKIVILDGSAANPGDITWGALEDLGEVTAYDTTSKEQLIERMQGAEAAITNKTVFDRDAFEKTSSSLTAIPYRETRFARSPVIPALPSKLEKQNEPKALTIAA